jgi:hypothetical protein
MLDHPVQQISGNKDPNAPPGAAAMDPMAMLGMFFKDIPVRNPLCLFIVNGHNMYTTTGHHLHAGSMLHSLSHSQRDHMPHNV